MTKGTKQKSNLKKKSESKTEWDDLDMKTLKAKIESLENEMEQAIHERIKVQTEHDAVLKYYNIASERRKQLQEQLQLERFQQNDILSKHNAEVQVYLDKMESLQYDFDCKLDFIEQELNMSCEKEIGNHQCQIQSNEMLVSNLKQELTKKKIENMQEIRHIKAQYEEEIDTLRHTLSAELDAFEESCSSRQQELEEKVDLKRRIDLSKSVEQLNIHLAELAKKHQELSDSTQAYWEEKINKNEAQVAKLKEESHKLDKVLHDNEMVIETLEKETAELTEPLSSLTSKVNELKHYLKDEERIQRSITSTKARIIIVDERITEQENANERLEKDIAQAKQVIERYNQDLKRMLDQINSPTYSSIEAIHDRFATLKSYMNDVKSMAQELQSRSDSENKPCMKFQEFVHRAALEIKRLSKENSLSIFKIE